MPLTSDINKLADRIRADMALTAQAAAKQVASDGVTALRFRSPSQRLSARSTSLQRSCIRPGTQHIPVNANALPTVSLTAPAANASYTLPATVTLSANASDVEVNTPISKVDFYQGTTLIGSDTTAPYSLTWTPTAAGTYSLTAKATDSGGAVTTSTAVSITVNTAVAAIYYIQGDHLGTPRIVTDGANKVVWRNYPLGEPFGLSPVEEDPDADGRNFVLNLRFAGQYYGSTCVPARKNCSGCACWLLEACPEKGLDLPRPLLARPRADTASSGRLPNSCGREFL